MTPAEIAELVSRGRTDLVFDLLASEEGRERVQDVLTWFIYYNDVTALRAVMHAGLGISGLDLDRELGHAAFFGHWKAADFLLAHGANVGWTEPETGETPLHSALCKAGRPHYGHVVRLLLDAGADPNARTIPGKETGAFMRPSCGMCARAEKRRCILLAHGANVGWTEPETGETPLHSALCKAGRPHYGHVVRLLLDAGADPNARTIPGKETGAFMRDVRTRGETPLHRAAAYADAAIIQLLLERGADRTLTDANGDTPLSWASLHLRPGAILALLAFPPHVITAKHIDSYPADHGQGWGGMEARTMGDYLPLRR